METPLFHLLKTSSNAFWLMDGKFSMLMTVTSQYRFRKLTSPRPEIDLYSDLQGIHNAIAEARQEKNKPTIIRLRTTIGYGSKQQGTHGVHGAREHLALCRVFAHTHVSKIALKADDIVQLKGKFGFPADQSFHVPQETYDVYAEIAKRGATLEQQWNKLLAAYGQKYPNEHAELVRRIEGRLPQGWEQTLPVYKPTDAAQASRKLSEIALTSIIPALPELLGGSADLTGSNLTKVKGSVDFQPPSTGLGTYKGTYVRYGVREHGMGAIANGLHAYGGIIPFVATFLVSNINKGATQKLTLFKRISSLMPPVPSDFLP